MHHPGMGRLLVKESLPELIVRYFEILDASKRNKEETMTRGADQFKTFFGVFNPFQVVLDSRNNHHSRAVFVVAARARCGLGGTHTDPFNQ